jgi:hypothetical protein
MRVTTEHMSTEALPVRLQRRWVALLRRAAARETAARRALAHARTVQSAQRSELATLHLRAQGLEQIVLNYAINRRVRQGQTAASIPAPKAATPTPALGPALLASTPAPAAGIPAPASTPAPAAPFDPVALVAAMLPLSEIDSEGINVADALSQMRSVGQPAIHPPPPVPALLDEPTTDGEADSDYWFPRAFRQLAVEDPREAGRLLLQLLPAQGLVWPEDVAYTLNVAETGFLSVTVSGETTTVQPLLSLDLTQAPALRTDLAGLARTVTARRGWGRIGARVSGARGTLRPLRALAQAPLSLRDLERQGIELDPALLQRLQAVDVAAPADLAAAA